MQSRPNKKALVLMLGFYLFHLQLSTRAVQANRSSAITMFDDLLVYLAVSI